MPPIGPNQVPSAAPSLTSPPPIQRFRHATYSSANSKPAPATACPKTTAEPDIAAAASPSAPVATVTEFGIRRRSRSQPAAVARHAASTQSWETAASVMGLDSARPADLVGLPVEQPGQLIAEEGKRHDQ